ncbi:MAG: hypothetical protein AAGB30_10995 [Pedobacter sp.]
MGKLHHTVRKAAVKSYGPLHEEGKSADEIKTAIAADEKGFDADQINEIYEAIVNPGPKEGDSPSYSVVSEFRDIDDFDKVHKPGDDVSHFDKDRIAVLLDRGHIELAD